MISSKIPDSHFFFTSESVTEGNSDKICDKISDTILDACLNQDPNSHVAIETAILPKQIYLSGEIHSKAKLNYEILIKNKLKEIGYDDIEKGFDYKDFELTLNISEQSTEIIHAVDHFNDKEDLDIGAGDQGMMFGYSTNENEELFPMSHLLALRITEKLTEVRKNNIISYLRPDGKSQVTLEYEKKENSIYPIRVENISISCQHNPNVDLKELRKDIEKEVIRKVVPLNLLDENTKFLINQSGIYVKGGPEKGVGLTGRKIIVDTYGGWGTHGGGAFSGKDSTKVDRSAAYAARWIAKSLVFNGLCERALVQLSYSIGLCEPISINVDSYGTVKKGYTDEDLYNIIIKNFNLKPGYIIKELGLKRGIFEKTSTNGHFGRNEEEFLWEKPKILNLN
jgi:S-adenosylmethionine synthetase